MGEPDPCDLLRAFLADRDVPCPGCGYNLRGLPSDRCPECNQPLVLRVGLAEPRLGAWLGAVSGLLSGAGAALVCLLIVAVFTLRFGPPDRREVFAIVELPFIMLAVDGMLAALLIRARGRAWFRSLTPIAQRAVIGGCWLLLCAFVVWFILSVEP